MPWVRASFVLWFALASCVAVALAQQQPSLVGTWEHKAGGDDDDAITVVLNADGTGVMDDEPIRYTVAGDRIQMTVDDEKLTYTFKFDGQDKLIVSGGDLDAPTTFTRKGAAPAPAKKGLGGRIKTPAAAGTNPLDDPAAPAPRTPGRNPLDEPATPSKPAPAATNPLDGPAPAATTKQPAANPLDGGNFDNPAGVAPRRGSDSVVGKWSAEGTVFEFTADGRFLFAGQPAEYKAADGKLTFKGPRGEAVWPYELAGDTLTVTVEGQRQQLTRVRDGGGAAAPAPAGGPAALVGTWDGELGTTTLRADGTMRMAGEEGRWQADATHITFADAKNWVKVPYKFDGADIVVLGDPAEGPGKTKTARRVTGPAGVWFGSEASVDPQFVMVVGQYLTLYPDGAVGFQKTESGANRQQVTANVERFRAWRERGGDRGRTYGKWTADGNRVTIQWQGAFGNRTVTGQWDPEKGKMALPQGILNEGDRVIFERQ